MGQYHAIANLTKHAGYSPRSLGNGIKLMEFGSDGIGAVGALIHLLANSWAGDRIAVVGDYSEPEDFTPEATAAAGCEPADVWAAINNSSGTNWKNVGWLARKVAPGEVTKIESSAGDFYRYAPQMRCDSKPCVILNTDKAEYLSPEGFGDHPCPGMFAVGGGRGGILTALAVVLAVANKGGARGGGDLRSDHAVVGSWGGDRITLCEPHELPATATCIDAHLRLALSEAREAWYSADENGSIQRFDLWEEERTQIGTESEIKRLCSA